MKASAIVMVCAVGAAGFLFLASPCYADTVEQQLDELRRTVTQLQKVVEEQSQKMKEQEGVIEGMKRQMCSPETAITLTPHLDKHLLHERSGVGEQLGNLRIGIGLTGVIQGSINGEAGDGEGRDQADGSWSADFEFQSPIGEHGTAFMRVEAGQGEGLDDEFEDVFQAVNGDALENESGMKVTEAWYERYFSDNRVAFTLGKLDLTNYFDTNAVANNERFQFLNGALVNSTAVEFPEDNGPGMRLAVYPADWLEMGLGWAESDADWEDIANDGFGIAEINLKPSFAEKQGNYRFYAWVNGSDKDKLDGNGSGDNGWGVGVSFDQKLTDSLTAFLRAGYQDDDVYEVEGAWSAGWELRGTKWNRENDVFGIAVSQTFINDEVEPGDTETLFEGYYSIAFNDRFYVSPDVQVILNPRGDGGSDAMVVLGTRMQMNF